MYEKKIVQKQFVFDNFNIVIFIVDKVLMYIYL